MDELEKISLAQARKVLGRYPLIHAVPERKKFSYFAPGKMVVEFPAQYFQTLRSYNILSISSLFYEPFLDFDYILIYQLDAFVFYDALEEFCALGYDYIGAPWPIYSYEGFRPAGKTPRVGNGGFCLRKVKACHKLLTKAESLPDWTAAREKYIEDTFFAACGITPETEFNVAPVEVAKLFAMEWHPDRHVKKIGGLPFGCHNWTRFGADFYAKVFARFGYDLRPFRELIADDDSKTLTFYLTRVALKRLTRQIEHEQSLLRYLPAKRFASVRVVRSPKAMKILSQLLEEDNSLTDKVFIYDVETWTDLLGDMTCENLPHLVIVSDYDVSLIDALESRGLRYGKHVISFQREYLKRCEELFHRLGR